MTYPSLRARIKVEWKSYLVAALFTVIAEYIGTVKLKVGPGMIILFPVFYAIILGMLSGPQVMQWFDNRHVKAASKLVIVGICPFVVNLGITAGANMDMILHAGPALLVHGFGNLLGIFFGLPLAMLLGLHREAIGATSSLNREYHLALINSAYGSDSDEASGSMAIYIVGGILGTIYFGMMATALGLTGWFDANTITAMASAANTIAGITGIYITLFLAIPLTDKLYNLFDKMFASRRAKTATALKGRIK